MENFERLKRCLRADLGYAQKTAIRFGDRDTAGKIQGMIENVGRCASVKALDGLVFADCDIAGEVTVEDAKERVRAEEMPESYIRHGEQYRKVMDKVRKHYEEDRARLYSERKA